MKPALKLLKLFAILLITVSVILFSASFFMQEKVADIIIQSLNRNISTKLDVGSFKLSFLKKFPKASLELKNILVLSSPDFNSESFKGICTDTLLAAKYISVDFKITDILKENYSIERIGVREGIINLFSDSSGLVNYDISVKNSKAGTKYFTLDLEKINLSDISFSYNNIAKNLVIKGLINNGNLKSRISGNNIDFNATADMQINRFQLYDTRISKPIAAGIDLILVSSKNGILFKKGNLRVENYVFGLSGLISSDNKLDLNLSGQNIDISKIRKYLPEKFQVLVSRYNPEGILIIESKIKGLITRTSNPHLEISCLLKNGKVTYGKSDLTIKDLSFEGYFSNGSKNHWETSSFSIKEIKAKLGSAEYTGSFVLSGFENPRINLFIKGKVFPAEIKEFFDLKNISTAKGFVEIDLNLAGKFIWNKPLSFSDIIDLKPKSELNFNSFSLGLKNDSILVENINGGLLFSNTILAKNFRFNFKNQGITIDGEFINLPEYLDGRPVQMIASADVSCTRLIPEVFLTNASSLKISATEKTGFTFPGNIILDLNFKIDSLNYKTYSLTKIFGSLTYKPRLLTFKSLNIQALSGSISGNGFLVQNINKSVIAKGIFNVSKIDVNKTFITFHNFGQNFLKAENIAGTLSGSLSLLLPMDSLLNPQIKSITAEGKYILINGALINFDPVKQLSSFIEISELENIHFAQMENDFFIKNNFLYIPQMDVKSNAADLSVNGKHSFDNDYEYHVKILLSQILSIKRKKNNNSVTEFGVVEDDGLGRTSLLLKIKGKGEDVKVVYDMKAAGKEVNNNIKTERQTLKRILNQEYGWYIKDTTTKLKSTEKRSRFRISWNETDSTKTDAVPQVEKKNDIKNIFKKK